jgi:acyl-[acyl-carrier-protein]-phospholipid O-acyltransferase/long-chain-fatty-acid--[acyl-carrier-protein] ligase
VSVSPIGLLKTRRLGPLALTQSCGALNDNLVKNAMVVLALFQLGVGGVGLSALAGALFIAPYILLSATAGKFADRFSKPRIILIYKAAELLLMAAAAAAFLTESVPGLLVVLTGLGVQATLFGPVKYSILPQLLAPGELVGGNALIEMGTFLAILLGTIGGGLAVAGGATGLHLLGYGLLAIAATGFATSLFVPAVRAENPSLRIDPNPVRPTVRAHC